MPSDHIHSPLRTGWTLRAISGPVPEEVAGTTFPASVPGCATTDLLAAGVIPDPYLDDNEESLHWIGRTEWCFATTLDLAPVAPGERLELVCDGLDTVASVALDGVVVARTQNMHRSYRIDLTDVARPGPNELAVTFESPLGAAERLSAELGPRPFTNHHPFNAIRKMACAYGWDWGPDLATSGIWRPIALERWRTARLATVRPLVTVDGLTSPGADGRPTRGTGHVELHVGLERAGVDGPELEVTAQLGEHAVTATLAPEETTATVTLEVGDIALWWPAGYGAQPLHELTVSVSPSREPERVLGSWRRRIGFRSVALETTPDEIGTAVALVVNGVRITARGWNWIPEDCFPSRVDRSRYAARLTDARESGANLLRVWGGGIYESEDFYELTDELGLLVWQDFLFACAAYSEEEPLRSEVEAEAREVVTGLAPHPSLAVWNGCNENLWGREDWGWGEELGDRTWGAGYYFELLPRIVGELDPTRPYSAGSPWSFGAAAPANDWRYGTMHVWDVWNQRNYTAYADHRPRFVSEFGFQGPPAWSTLSRAVHDSPRRASGPLLAAHQKAEDGMDKLAAGLAPHIDEPAVFEDWHWATSLGQARAVAFAVEWWRSIDPPCTGMVVWQLNDCWPVISWAAVDGDGRRKPLWYAARRVFGDHLLTLQSADDGGVELIAVNDGPTIWSASVRLARRDFTGRDLATDLVSVEVPPGGRVRTPLGSHLAKADDPRREVLSAAGPERTAWWWWSEDRELELPVHDPYVSVGRAATGWDVTVSSDVVLKDVALLVDKVEPNALVDDMLVTVPAGGSVTFRVTGDGVDPDRLADPRVLRSANQLVRTD